MPVRRCNCSGHSGSSTTSIPPNQPLPAYHQPNKAILIHLNGFPISPNSNNAHTPLLTQLLSRSTDMHLKWRVDDDCDGLSSSSSSFSSSPISNPDGSLSVSVASRLLGLSLAEQIAEYHRRQQLIQTRTNSGVVASPAAAYPPTFGRARIEVATNSLHLYERIRQRRETLQRTHATNHVQQPIFLQPQIATLKASTSALSSPFASPFVAEPRPPLQSHSSVPITDAKHRSRYIEAIVCHIADRLGYRLIDDQSDSIPSDTSDHPHILLLHLDVESLLGPIDSTVNQSDYYRHAALFIEQLIHALLTRVVDPTLAAQTVPSQTAIESSAARCPHLLWSIINDHQPVEKSSPVNSRILSFLKPVQTFQVEDGCIDRRQEGSDSEWHGTVERAGRTEKVHEAAMRLFQAT